MKEFINDNFFMLIILLSILTFCILMLIAINKTENDCKKNNNDSFMCKPIQEVYK